MKPKIILGIDPGTRFTGYGVIIIKEKTPEIITYGYFDLSKIKNSYETLIKIFSQIVQLIDEYNISELAVESTFLGKNVQSMMKLGRAQGVAIAAGLSRGLSVFEYPPRKIKLAVTGNGNASKEQVASFLQKMNLLKEIPEKLDATDGIAVALCHHFQSKVISGKTYLSWKEFIQKNPSKLINNSK